MKRLIVMLLAVLLLTGCGAAEPTDPSETTQPTQLTTAVAEPITLLSGTNGSISTYALDVGIFAGMLRLGENNLLLTTDSTMYLLSGDELQLENTHVLSCQLFSNDPSIVLSNNQMSFFDARREVYVMLGPNIAETSIISIQDNVVAGPLMSPDFSTIYYCTDEGVRAMDMATGNSRLLRQEHQPIVSLDGLLFDGTVLRYTRTISYDKTESCFISTTDGSQSSFTDLGGEITTWGENYAAITNLELPVENFRQILTGTIDSDPQVMTVENTWDDALFPGEGTLLLETLTDSGLLLELYNLNTGSITAQTTFDGRVETLPHAWKDGDSIWLWEESSGQFYRWNYVQDAAQGESMLAAQATLTSPDQAAMDQVEQQRLALEETYGISLRIAERENRTTGVDYSVFPDYRPGQYLAALNLLSDAMAQFPEGFFAKLKNTAIELVDDFDPAAGVQSGTGSLEIGEETVIRVCISSDMQPVFYHELFHAMELEIQNKTNRLSGWEGLNPDGFEYSGSYTAYENGELADSEFLIVGENAVTDEYCLVNAREDRAQTFMYAMMEGEERRFQSEVTQDKLALLSDAIRRVYDWQDVEESFPWEQYISK